MKSGRRGNVLRTKKGLIFTISTILFLAVFIFAFSSHFLHQERDSQEVTDHRLSSMDNFLRSTKRDLSRGLFISSYRSILFMEEYMVNNGQYIDNVTLRFEESIMNGTVNQTQGILMIGSTMPLWIERIKAQGERVNLDVNITVNGITVRQDSPWVVTVVMDANITMVEKSNLGRFDQRTGVETNVSIVGFEDPMYIINGVGRLTNLVVPTYYENNFTYTVNGTWNVDNLINHTQEGYYLDSTTGPSFLMRMEGDYGDSPVGIESLVDLQKLSIQDLEVYDRSIVDYIYWGGQPTDNYRINFTPNWFKLDLDHLPRYEVQGLSYQ